MYHGDNGCGKTTLINIRSNESLVGREDIHIGYMPQNYDEILDAYESPIDFLTTVGIKRILHVFDSTLVQ